MHSQNFSFAQSYTDESEIYAFPSGATVTPNLTLVGNGVTYAPRNTAAQSISNTDLSRSYNNTVASVSRSGGVFTFAFEEALPSFTSHFGSIFIRAVSKGKWVEYSPSSVTVGSQNFSFTQSYTDESEIYAFPSGATVGPILSIVGNGVTYTPRNNRAQSVSNTSDLSRTLSDSPSWSTSDNAFIITLPDNATISSASGSVSTTTKNHNQIFQKSEISTLTCGYSSNKIKITSATFDSNTILLSDDSFTLPAGLSVVANGVTYNVAAQTVAVTKTGSQQLLSSLFAISAEYSVIIATFYFILNSSSYSPASHPSSIYLRHPTTQDFGDEDGNIEAVTISDGTSQITDSGEMALSVRANFNATSFSLSDPVFAEIDGNEWYVSDTSGNVWKLPSRDYEFRPV